jgi:hypothetical protein
MVITIPKTVEHALRIPQKNQEKELRKLLTFCQAAVNEPLGRKDS